MSWDIYLVDKNGKMVTVSQHSEGANVCIAIYNEKDELIGHGSTEADINVTWNYGQLFRFPELLHKKQAKKTIKILKKAIKELGPPLQDEDYWAVTKGNVSHCLTVLLGWAEQHPKAFWEVH